MKNAIIICWFGIIPNYFNFFLKSCKINKDYDFLIFTDQKIKAPAENIIIIKKTLDEMNTLFSKKLKMNIKISKPYKLCDFRPAYGKIFEDYLVKYKFWGHCDIDQIFGKINSFITTDILNKYERINHNGHLSLYKNCAKINNLYTKTGSPFSIKDVFSSENNYAFDEYSGINLIAKYNNIKEIYINDFCDINVRYKRYKCKNNHNVKNQIYSWEEGKVYKYSIKNGIVQKEEKMYLHFQKKLPSIKIGNQETKYLIGEKGFVEFENINLSTIAKNNKYKGHIYELYEFIVYYIKKIYNFITMNNNQKTIWIKQRKNKVKV